MSNAQFFEPNRTLKQKVGPEIDKVFAPEKIEAAQADIDGKQAEFLEWVAKDLVQVEHACRGMEHDVTQVAKLLPKLIKTAFSIKSQSGTFGYDLASRVAKSLYDFGQVIAADEKHVKVVRMHVDALRTIFQQSLKGDGGVVGKELMTMLETLVAKTAPAKND